MARTYGYGLKLAHGNDAVGALLTISPAAVTQAQGTTFTFTVTRTGDLSGTSSVDWAVTGSGGSPASAADFVQ